MGFDVADAQRHIRIGRGVGAGVVAQTVFAMPVIGDARQQAAPDVGIPAQIAVPTRGAGHIGVAPDAIAGVVARQAAPEAIADLVGEARHHLVGGAAIPHGGGGVEIGRVIVQPQIGEAIGIAGIEAETAAGDIVALGGFQPHLAVAAQLQGDAAHAGDKLGGGARHQAAVGGADIAAGHVGIFDAAHDGDAGRDADLARQFAGQHHIAATIPVGFGVQAQAGIALHGGAAIGGAPQAVAPAHRQHLCLVIPQGGIFVIGMEGGLGRHIDAARHRLGRRTFHHAAAHLGRRRHGRALRHGRSGARHDPQREAVRLGAGQEGDGPWAADHAIVEIGIGHRDPGGQVGGQPVEGRAVHGGLEIDGQGVLVVVGLDRLQRQAAKAHFHAIGILADDLVAGAGRAVTLGESGGADRDGGQQQGREQRAAAKPSGTPKHPCPLPFGGRVVNRG